MKRLRLSYALALTAVVASSCDANNDAATTAGASVAAAAATASPHPIGSHFGSHPASVPAGSRPPGLRIGLHVPPKGSNASSSTTTTMATTTTATTAASSNTLWEMDLLAPTYYGNYGNPANWWTDMENNWPNWGTDSIVVVNESSGPGTAPDDTLYQNISDFLNRESYKPKVLGYVWVGDELDPSDPMHKTYLLDQNGHPYLDTTRITTDIQNWANWYGDELYGVFFDGAERSSVPSTKYPDAQPGQFYDVAQMEYVVGYALSINATWLAFNTAGAYNTTEFLFKCTHQLTDSWAVNTKFVTLEGYESDVIGGYWDPYFAPPDGIGDDGILYWVHAFPAIDFAGLVHDADASGTNVNADLTKMASWAMADVFVTNQPYPTQWHPGPSPDVWSAEGNITGEGITWSYGDGDTGTVADVTCPQMSPDPQ